MNFDDGDDGELIEEVLCGVDFQSDGKCSFFLHGAEVKSR